MGDVKKIQKIVLLCKITRQTEMVDDQSDSGSDWSTVSDDDVDDENICCRVCGNDFNESERHCSAVKKLCASCHVKDKDADLIVDMEPSTEQAKESAGKI